MTYNVIGTKHFKLDRSEDDVPNVLKLTIGSYPDVRLHAENLDELIDMLTEGRRMFDLAKTQTSVVKPTWEYQPYVYNNDHARPKE